MRSQRLAAFVALILTLLIAASGREPVRARQAMVVAQEPNAADVGVTVLKAGGNAVDAAVAVAFTLAVTHPFAGNIGGGGFLLRIPMAGQIASLNVSVATAVVLFEWARGRGFSGASGAA